MQWKPQHTHPNSKHMLPQCFNTTVPSAPCSEPYMCSVPTWFGVTSDKGEEWCSQCEELVPVVSAVYVWSTILILLVCTVFVLSTTLVLLVSATQVLSTMPVLFFISMVYKRCCNIDTRWQGGVRGVISNILSTAPRWPPNPTKHTTRWQQTKVEIIAFHWSFFIWPMSDHCLAICSVS